jgi:hypothetical protein
LEWDLFLLDWLRHRRDEDRRSNVVAWLLMGHWGNLEVLKLLGDCSVELESWSVWYFTGGAVAQCWEITWLRAIIVVLLIEAWRWLHLRCVAEEWGITLVWMDDRARGVILSCIRSVFSVVRLVWVRVTAT